MGWYIFLLSDWVYPKLTRKLRWKNTSANTTEAHFGNHWVNEIKQQSSECNEEKHRFFLVMVKLLNFLNTFFSLRDTIFLANLPYIIIDFSVPYQLRIILNLQTFPSKLGVLFTRILFSDQQLVMALRQAHLPPSTPRITSPHAAVCAPVSITGAICSEHAGRHVTALRGSNTTGKLQAPAEHRCSLRWLFAYNNWRKQREEEPVEESCLLWFQKVEITFHCQWLE